VRREMEYKEMVACTFAPEISREPVRQPEGPVIVRGLGKFLETKELAKRLEEEQRFVRLPTQALVPLSTLRCLFIHACIHACIHPSMHPSMHPFSLVWLPHPPRFDWNTQRARGACVLFPC
jgi:hypothetical protein